MDIARPRIAPWGLTVSFVLLTSVSGCYETYTIMDEATDGESAEREIHPGGTLLWVRRAGGSLQDYGRGIATQPDGAALVNGRFGCGAVFGPGEPEEVSPGCLGEADVFTMRYTSDGRLDWISTAGGDIIHLGDNLAAFPDGAALATGHFEETISFGDEGPALSAPDGIGAYVAKWRPGGGVAWVRRTGGSGQAHGLSVAALPDGSSFLVGHFFGAVTFGPDEPEEVSLFSGDTDIFISRLRSDGTLDWVRRIPGEWNDSALAVASGPDTGTLTGYFSESVTFAAGEANAVTLTAEDRYEMYLARYTTDGELSWVREAGGPGDDYGVAVAMDDDIIVTGIFEETLVFGEGGPTLVAEGLQDVFVARYTADGELVWARQAGGGGADSSQGIAMLPGGGVAIIGDFSGTARFGAGEAGETVLESAGDTDVFLAALDAEGELMWVVRAGGDYKDRGYGVALSADNRLYATGYFSGDARFGDTSLTSADDYDIFIAKLASGF